MTFFEKTLQAMGADQAREENARSLAVSSTVDEAGPGFEWVAKARRQVALRHALLRGALAEVVGAVEDDIPYIILKGEPLGRMLYGDASLRSSTDIDLLVLPGDYEEVRRRLIGLGYVPKREDGPYMWAYNQEEFRHSVHGASLEIHWILSLPALPAMSPQPLFETRQPFSLGDLEISVLRGDWMGIHLALHFQQHSGFAKGLLDMAAWCDQVAPGLEREAFLEKTRGLRLEGLVQWPLHTLEILCGERPPMYVADVDQSVKAWATVSAWALRDSLSRKFRGGVQDSLASLNPTVDAEISVPMRALTMLVVDGSVGAKIGAFWRPVLEGPHFVGRAVQRWGLVR